MAYSQRQYEAMTNALGALPGLSEKKMFGGICFLLNGNMLCGVHKSGGMARVGEHNEAAALAIDGVAPLGFTGRRMRGMVEMDDDVFEDPERLDRLLSHALGFVAGLPAK